MNLRVSQGAKTILLGLLSLMLASSALAQSSSTTGKVLPIFGELKPGPYPVGYRIIHLKDRTRLVRPKRDYLGAPDTQDRSLPIEVHVWYPAADTAGAPFTFEDYIYYADYGAPNETTRSQQRDFVRRTQFPGRLSDPDWQRLLNSPMLAQRDAREASGKFPLLLGELRPLSTSLTHEFLASHGYVVVMVESNDGGASAAPKEESYRNLEFAYAQTRTMPNVDQNVTATLGFSAFGVAQIIYAMRTHEVDAIVSLESGFFFDSSLYDSAKALPGYDVNALRAPLLHVFRSGKERKASLDDFEAMRYSTRYHYLVDAPEMRHSDFTTEGMAASTVLNLRAASAPLLRKAFELTNVYVLNFFNAYLKHDVEALSFLRRDPVANGAPEKMISVVESLGVKPAPSGAEFLSLINSLGLERALVVFREARKADPEAPLFREATMNQVANQLGGSRRFREAIEVYKLSFESYPKSSQTSCRLGFSYEEAGEKQLALEFFDRCLQLVEADPNQSESEKQFIKTTVPRRITALKADLNK